MRSQDCLDVLNEAEQRLPVTEWELSGVHVWPLARFLFWWFSNDDYERQRARIGTHSRFRRVRQLPAAGTSLARFAYASVRDPSHNASPQPADAVLLGDNYSRVWINGASYDRHCGPILDALDQLGLRGLHVEPYHHYPVPRSHPSLRIQPRLDVAWLRSRRRSGPPPRLPGHEDFVRLATRHEADPGPISAENLHRHAQFVRLIADHLRRILDAAQPRVGFVVDLGNPSMGFNVACREAGIPSVELQHGAVYEGHWASTRWEAVPDAGWSVLPRSYWVWSRHEAAVIRAWSGMAAPWHQPFVGGNPWLVQWQDDEAELVRHYDRAVEDALPVASGPRVLVTLQTGLSYASLDEILAAVGGAPANWAWWMRLHPTMSRGERRDVERRLTRAGFPIRHVRAATDLPLYALLRVADVHLTRNSSTVIEAADFRVPSVVTGPEALEMYRAQVQSGLVSLATDADSIVRALASAAGRTEIARPRSVPVSERVRELLESYGATVDRSAGDG